MSDVVTLDGLTDKDALAVANILGGCDHVSDESKITQIKELLCTNKLYNHQTNIPGIRWYRCFKYLESVGYEIENNKS